MRPRISIGGYIRPSVGASVRPMVRPSVRLVFLLKARKIDILDLMSTIMQSRNHTINAMHRWRYGTC